MKTKATTKNTPRLRFKEFKDEWGNNKLGFYTDSISSGKSSTKDILEGKFPVYGSTGQIGQSDSFDYSGNKILVARVGANAGSTYQASGKYSVSDNTLILELKNSLDINFAFNLIKKANLKKLVFGSGQPLVTGGHLKSLKVSVPSLKEQEKIAGFLESVDEKIGKLVKKKKQFEKYKKGVMQEIFSQEIRFKKSDGACYPYWEEKKLGEIGDFKTSSIDKLIDSTEKEVRLVNYMNVYRHEDLTFAKREGLSLTSANDRQVKENNLLRGDILFTPSSETPSDIGHSVVITENLADTVYSYHLVRFRPRVRLNLSFTHYFCNIADVLKQISKRCQGSTRFTITVGEFGKVRVKLPNDKNEQAKIGEFLTSLDGKINLINKELGKAQEFKKALLQQMFV